MITAVDTNVLLDVFWSDPVFGERSAESLRRCLQQGTLVACEVVWAELVAAFPSHSDLRDAMETLGVSYSSIEVSAAMAAGDARMEYRNRGGGRDRLLADWLIRGHALHQADRLLTRDRGLARTYLPVIPIIDPSDGP